MKKTFRTLVPDDKIYVITVIGHKVYEETLIFIEKVDEERISVRCPDGTNDKIWVFGWDNTESAGCRLEEEDAYYFLNKDDALDFLQSIQHEINNSIVDIVSKL